MPRRILRAKIKTLSLCPRGANELQTIYKSDDNIISLQGLTKALDNFDERGELSAVVWTPNRKDAEGDWADETVIKEMAYGWMKDYQQLDLKHDGKLLTKEQVYPAESFIIQKNDPRFAELKDHRGATVDPTGGWGVILKIEDPNLRKLYKEGSWTGISMEGPAVLKQEDTEDSIVNKILKALGIKKEKEISMTKEEIAALLKEQKDAILAEVAKINKPEEKKKIDETTPDLTNPEAIRKHIAKLELAKIDLNDPEALKKHLETLEKKDDKKPENDDAEVAALQKSLKETQDKLDKLQKKSKQPDTKEDDVTITKEHTDLIKLGRAMADQINKRFTATK